MFELAFFIDFLLFSNGTDHIQYLNVSIVALDSFFILWQLFDHFFQLLGWVLLLLHLNLLLFSWGHFVLMELRCLISGHVLLQAGVYSSKYFIYKHVVVFTEYLVFYFDCRGSYFLWDYMNFTFRWVFDIEEVHQKRLIVKASDERAQIVSLSICKDDD